MKSAIVILLYAAALMVMGLIFFNTSSEDVSKTGMLVAPAITAGVFAALGAALGVLLLIEKIDAAKRVHLAAFLAMIVFCLFFVWRATEAAKSAAKYEQAVAGYERLVNEGRVQDTDKARTGHLTKQGAPAKDGRRLVNAHWAYSGLTLVAMVVVLSARPKVVRRRAERPPVSRAA